MQPHSPGVKCLFPGKGWDQTHLAEVVTRAFWDMMDEVEHLAQCLVWMRPSKCVRRLFQNLPAAVTTPRGKIACLLHQKNG